MTPRMAIVAALLAASCGSKTPAPEPGPVTSTPAADNPLMTESPLPFQYPPFDKIKDEHFGPAFDLGMKQHRDEVAAIANSPEPPTFDNTIVALERAGGLLDRATTVFFNLIGADTNDARKKLQVEYSPKLSAHVDSIQLDSKLFERIRTIYEQRKTLGLDAESLRLVERYHTEFVRAGAQLSEADKARLKEINTELAKLGTEFSQKVLEEVNASAVVFDSAEELEGLPPEQIEAAAAAAKERGMDGKFVLALLNTTGQPANAYLKNRKARERVHKASVTRGSRGNELDTTAIVARVALLRAQRANMLGFPNHAAYVLADETAGTPKAVNERLAQLAPAAVANARREAAAIADVIKAEGGAFKPQPWDWAYYTEKVRRAKYDFDESQLKPYLELDRVLEDGVFFAAGKLFGLSFKERTDLPVYHPDVRVFDVFDADGAQLAIFLFDPFARPSKRGGAWMNAYVAQTELLDRKPVIGNHLNITKPVGEKPVLLSWDEVTTLFHEFGHALHGMLSDVRYPHFGGTRVPRDFVEYPSQVNEMWASWPEVLENYARHHETGEPMPRALVDKVLSTQKFNQGFATTEYLAAALLDQRWHQLKPSEVPAAADVMKFEAEALKEDGVDYPLVPPRYRTPYFSHIMGGYSAGYYAYVWSEVLDADTVQWFKESGGLTRANGDHFRKTLLSRGGSVDAMDLFRGFRGREPNIQPLLERKGLVPAATRR